MSLLPLIGLPALVLWLTHAPLLMPVIVIAVSAVVVSGLVIATDEWLLRRSLAPLHELTAAAARIATGDFEQRLATAGMRDEVYELAATLNELLDRTASLMDSQRRFVANASHELRTPLAVMRTEIDVTLADEAASAAELRRMGGIIRAATIRANDLVEALLLLARTEAQRGRRLAKVVPVDLAMGVPRTLRAVQPEVTRLGLTVHTQFNAALVAGDPSLLERLAGNLIENAIRYNVAGGTLQVSTLATEGSAYLVVCNTGEQLNPAEVPQLFEPFRRGGPERTGTRGNGLGLSIVRAVADAHGGTVSATALAGGGLEVTVKLPGAARR